MYKDTVSHLRRPVWSRTVSAMIRDRRAMFLFNFMILPKTPPARWGSANYDKCLRNVAMKLLAHHARATWRKWMMRIFVWMWWNTLSCPHALGICAPCMLIHSTWHRWVHRVDIWQFSHTTRSGKAIIQKLQTSNVLSQSKLQCRVIFTFFFTRRVFFYAKSNFEFGFLTRDSEYLTGIRVSVYDIWAFVFSFFYGSGFLREFKIWILCFFLRGNDAKSA